MAGKVIQREALIGEIESVDVLRERLKAAERLAILFGWCVSRHSESERDRLAYEAWREWHDLLRRTGMGDLASPKANQSIDLDLRVREGRN